MKASDAVRWQEAPPAPHGGVHKKQCQFDTGGASRVCARALTRALRFTRCARPERRLAAKSLKRKGVCETLGEPLLGGKGSGEQGLCSSGGSLGPTSAAHSIALRTRGTSSDRSRHARAP
eukprot:2549600-Pleurochrysis_carterae.AAC.3